VALEHVAQGQTRFFTPGVAPDPRGILLGRFCLMTFPTLEGGVSWLRLYSSEASLDELMANLTITKTRTALGGREIVIQIPAVSSYAADRAARLARLVGGAMYTGTSKHFVKYRDDRSPYGYDAVDIGTMPATTDFMVHGDEFTQGYVREGDLPFARLLFRLSIRKLPGGERLGPEDRADLFLAVAHGLADGIIRYLWRNRVEAQAGLFTPQTTSAFDDHARDRGYMWIRARNLPERILALFLGTPGIDVFRPAGANAAVAVGYEHPIDLASCQSVFPAETFHVFWPNDRVDVLPGPVELSDIGDLTRVDLELDRPREPVAQKGGAAEPIGVELRLAAAMGPPRRVVATLIPSEHASRLKRILFALPPVSLRGHRVAVTDRGLLVVGSENLDVIPLGQLLCELTPGLLVPLGMDVVPRVSPEVLARALGHATGVVTVFTPDDRPFQIPDSAFSTLERRSLAKMPVERASVEDLGAEPSPEAEVVNDAVGRFALWGFPDAPDRKLLPDGRGGSGSK
jgi:FtsH ternary system domain X7